MCVWGGGGGGEGAKAVKHDMNLISELKFLSRERVGPVVRCC